MFEVIDIEPQENDSRMLGALAYAGAIFIGFLAPLLIYLLAREDRFAKFHALQSLILSVVLFVVIMIVAVFTLGLGLLLLVPLYLVLYLYLAYLAYQGQAFSVPYVTDFVLKNI